MKKVKLVRRDRVGVRDYMIRLLLDRINHAVSVKGHVCKAQIKGIHAFFSTQYEALKEAERETGAR